VLITMGRPGDEVAAAATAVPAAEASCTPTRSFAYLAMMLMSLNQCLTEHEQVLGVPNGRCAGRDRARVISGGGGLHI
jgi:hypothetical protein